MHTTTYAKPAVVLVGVGKRYFSPLTWLRNLRTSITPQRALTEKSPERWALKNLTLSIHPGEIIGFIGPNGAGKTTLMKIMAGLSRPTCGEVIVLGRTLSGRSPVIPPGIGVVMEQVGFIPGLSAYKNLYIIAQIQNHTTPAKIRSTLELVGLDPTDKRPVRAYSLGMRQRLGLAQALMEDPQLLLLDEPTNGLDPAGIIELRQLLRQLASQGVAIFLASHLLTEVERLCQRVLLVSQGEVRKEISLHEMEQAPIQITVRTEHDLQSLQKWMHHHNIAIQSTVTSGSFPQARIRMDGLVSDLLPGLLAAGIRIESIGKTLPSLESEYLAVLAGGETRP